MQNGKLFAVQTIRINEEQSALRWLEIGNPLTAPVLLDSGIINPPDVSAYYGSISVNPAGQAVIGFSGSGPNDYPSSYAVAGTLVGDKLTFGDPILLKAGEGTETSGRFGDYSTTTYDPSNPSHFWTTQEWATAGGTWSTQISEIVFPTAGPIQQTWFGGTGNFSDPNDWTPTGSPEQTQTLVINAGRVRAVNLTIINPMIQLGSASSTPTLVLNNSTLANSNTISVGILAPPDAGVSARVRVVGAVRDEGTIGVGRSETDASQPSSAHLIVNIAQNSSFMLGESGRWNSLGGSTIYVNARGDNATFVNDGVIQPFGGTVTMNAPVSGQGSFLLGNNNSVSPGILEFRDSVASSETVRFGSGLLKLDEPLTFLGNIQGFNAADNIELVGTKATSLDYDPNDPGVLKVFDHQKLVAALDIAGDFTTGDFQLARQEGNTFITLAQPWNDAAAMAAIPTVNHQGLQEALAADAHGVV